MVVAAALLTAEILHAVAFTQTHRPAAMLLLQRSAGVFPLDFRLRQAPAVFCSETRWKGSGPDCIAALRAELRVNPFSADLRRNLAGFLIEAGDMEGAKRELGVVSALQPGRNIVLSVNVNPGTR